MDVDREEARDAARYGDADLVDDGRPSRREAEAQARADAAYDAEHPYCRVTRDVEIDGRVWVEQCSLRNMHGRPHPGPHHPDAWGRWLKVTVDGIWTDEPPFPVPSPQYRAAS